MSREVKINYNYDWRKVLEQHIEKVSKESFSWKKTDHEPVDFSSAMLSEEEIYSLHHELLDLFKDVPTLH